MIPKINFDFKDYSKLIDFDTVDPTTEPPLTKKHCSTLSGDEL